jgi:hypothetical protein
MWMYLCFDVDVCVYLSRRVAGLGCTRCSTPHKTDTRRRRRRHKVESHDVLCIEVYNEPDVDRPDVPPHPLYSSTVLLILLFGELML